MTRKALARRIAEVLFNEPANAARRRPPPQTRKGRRGFWPDALLLVGQRPQRVFSLLASRHPSQKFAAALLYEPQTWCTAFLRNTTHISTRNTSGISCARPYRTPTGTVSFEGRFPRHFVQGYDR